MVAHSHSWQRGAGCWPEVSVPVHMGLSTGLLGLPLGLWLASPRPDDPTNQDGSFMPLRPGFGGHTSTLHHILCVTHARPDSVSEGTTLGVDTRR